MPSHASLSWSSPFIFPWFPQPRIQLNIEGICTQQWKPFRNLHFQFQRKCLGGQHKGPRRIFSDVKSSPPKKKESESYECLGWDPPKKCQTSWWLCYCCEAESAIKLSIQSWDTTRLCLQIIASHLASVNVIYTSSLKFQIAWSRASPSESFAPFAETLCFWVSRSPNSDWGCTECISSDGPKQSYYNWTPCDSIKPFSSWSSPLNKSGVDFW